MGATRYNPRPAVNRRNNETWGDLEMWNRANSGDNEREIRRLKKRLRQAMDAELTPRQKKIMHLHYHEGLTVTQIAQQEGMLKSSVSRLLQRGTARLKRYLKYSL